MQEGRNISQVQELGAVFDGCFDDLPSECAGIVFDCLGGPSSDGASVLLVRPKQPKLLLTKN
eukprot:11699233-Karenia_brevis.AAC.1